jgi:hypothetical protein
MGEEQADIPKLTEDTEHAAIRTRDARDDAQDNGVHTIERRGGTEYAWVQARDRREWPRRKVAVETAVE